MLELSPDAAAVPAEATAANPQAAAVETGTHRRGLGLVFWLCVAWICVVILAAIFASVLPLKNPDTPLAVPRLGPSLHYPFGTDDLGRDMLSRIVYGARVSIIVGFSSIALGLVVGGTLGLIAGYYKGRIGRVIMGCMDVLLAFPALVLALALIAFLGQSLRNVVIAIGVLSIAPVARVIRASTLSFSEREFVVAARALGAKNFRIITKEILPNVAVPTMSFALVAVAVAIVAEGGLAFLGLSVRPPTPSWGGSINEGRTYLAHAPTMSLIPAAVLFVTVLSFNFVGDSLRTRFDPRRSALS
jgi:ABC-type dipeptide/oligopeptide/nickel transport system permease subunit